MPRKFKPKPITSFDIFWTNYPRKESRKKAAQSWQTLKLDARDLIKILTWLEFAVQSDQWKGRGRFIPMAATFLNQERWLSEPPMISVPADGLTPSEPGPPKSAAEVEEIALSVIFEAKKRLEYWNEAFDSHTHSDKCQHGFVCAYVAEKRPQVPTLSQARAAYRRMNGTR
jgi:hypothetical protein